MSALRTIARAITNGASDYWSDVMVQWVIYSACLGFFAGLAGGIAFATAYLRTLA